jgi:dTDP-4-dehydrorhamnose 3,5-epimerase
LLDGIIIKPLKRNVDERGSFSEILRTDWKEMLGEDNLSQANLSMTYPGMVRAWHRHERGQIDYFVVLKGALKICAFDDASQELDEIISTEGNLQIVRIPGKYWHGFKVVGNKLATLVYFVNMLYEYSNPDEIRRAWNDPTIIPRAINGNTSDPRCNRSWDWFYVPFK